MRVILVSLVIFASIFGCVPNIKTDSDTIILARIGGQEITLRQLAKRFKPLVAQNIINETNFEKTKQSILQQLISESLILDEAKRRSVTLSTSELTDRLKQLRLQYNQDQWNSLIKDSGMDESEWQSLQHRRLLIEKTVDALMADRIKISDNEISAYYNDHPEENQLPARCRLKQILVSTKDEAIEIRNNLIKGGSFAKLAQKHSKSPDASNGGDLGLLSSDEMIPTFNDAWEMRLGEISEVVKSDYGYHIFTVVEKQPTVKLSFTDRKKNIYDKLYLEKKRIAYRELLTELHSHEKIVLNTGAMSGISMDMIKLTF